MRSYLASLSLATTLLSVLLFNSVSGCKPDTIVVDSLPKPDDKPTPLADSDSVFTIPESISTLTYPNVPTPPANTRLKRVIVRSLDNQPLKRMPITVTVDGQRLRLTLQTLTTYEYDSKDRLIAQYDEADRGNITWYDTNTYQHDEAGRYILTKLIQRHGPFGLDIYREADTLWLDTRGLARNRLGEYGYDRSVYDTAGFLQWGERITKPRGEVSVRIEQVIVGSNVVEYSYDLAGFVAGISYRRYAYTTQANLPNPTPFFGRTSASLPTEEVFSMKDFAYEKNGDQSRTWSIYRFDGKGRVKRALRKVIRLGNWANIYRGDLAIVDYEYE